METVAELVSQGARLVFQAARHPESRTTHLRALAKVLVDLRSQFQHEDHPDWAGRSWEYRSCAQELYERSGVTPDEVEQVQSLVRYHVGNLLREKLTSEELALAGLRRPGPRQRIQEGREEDAKVLEAIDAVIAKEASPNRALRLATAAQMCLERLSDLKLTGMTSGQETALADTLGTVEQTVTRLRLTANLPTVAQAAAHPAWAQLEEKLQAALDGAERLRSLWAQAEATGWGVPEWAQFAGPLVDLTETLGERLEGAECPE